MADVKWIKITTDIFDDEKILLIETLPDADSIIVIWFKLLCMAGKQNNSGVFMMNDKMAFTDKMLSAIFRRNENTVKLAIDTFEKFGMIEIVDDVITIPNWGKHQNFDKIEKQNEYQREYMREYRKKQKGIACKPNSNTNVSALELELELDKDINNTCSPEDERLIASKENFEKIYSLYPKKTGKAKALEYYVQWHKGRKLSGFDKAIKLTNKQMYIATMKYVAEKKDSETDLQYYKGFDVFMNKAILDYLEGQNE